MAKRKKVEKDLNEEEFKQRLFNWAIKHDPYSSYMDDDEDGDEINQVIERYQAKLPGIKIAFTVVGADMHKIRHAFDDLDLSPATVASLRRALDGEGEPGDEV